LINVSAVNGVARIDFGYNVGGGAVWYDSVSIRPYAPVERAYILAGHAVTPIHTIASLELVLCGLDADSPRAELDDVDVGLALLVWGGGRWRPAPRVFNFGFNTAEAVSLNVETRLVNGTVRIAKGEFKPMLLAEEPPEPDIPPPYAAFKPRRQTAGSSWPRWWLRRGPRGWCAAAGEAPLAPPQLYKWRCRLGGRSGCCTNPRDARS
jgi:hypothetical protein